MNKPQRPGRIFLSAGILAAALSVFTWHGQRYDAPPGAEVLSAVAPAPSVPLFTAEAIRNADPRQEGGAARESAAEVPQALPLVDPLEAFQEWTRSFMTASVEERKLMEEQGIELARQRRAAMARMIEEDPQQALELAVPFSVRSQLPAGIREQLEDRVSGRGMLGVLGVLIEPGTESDFSPITRVVHMGDQNYRAYVYGRRLSQPTVSDVSLHGIALDGRMAVHENPVRVLERQEAALYLASERVRETLCPVSGDPTDSRADERVVEVAGEVQVLCQGGHIEVLNDGLILEEESTSISTQSLNAWSQGDKTLLYIRVRFADQGADPQTLESVQSMMASANNFFVENSYKTTSITTTITPVYVMSKAAADYADIYAVRNEALSIATANGYDYRNYNLDAVRYAGGPGNFGGAAYVRARGCWMKSSSAGVAAHEFGHNYGLYHANYLEAQSDSIIGPGSWSHYGDSFDTMGAASAGNNHFNTRYKSVLNWIPVTGYQSVIGSGIYRVYAHDQVSSSEAVRALRIPRSSTKNYWVEFRQKFTGNAWLMNGASIRRADNANNNNPGSELLDMTPGSPDGKTDSALVIGRTFSDAAAGVHITPVSKGGTAPESLDVVVHIGSFPGNQKPLLTLSSSATAVPAGTAVTFSAGAVDPDGDALAYSWDFGDKSFGPNSATATRSWSAAGEYLVRCVVSDMKGGVASRWVVVRVGSPSTFRISGRVTDEQGQGLEGARVHNGRTTSSYRGGFSDSDGNYMITGLASGSYTVGAVKNGVVLNASSFSNPVSVGPNATGMDFTASAVTYTIAGRVTDAGLAVGDVLVSDGFRTATTDSNGDYTIRNVPNGSYTVTANKSGFVFGPSGWSNPVLVDSGPVTDRNFNTQTYTISGEISGVSVNTVVTVTDGYRTTTSYKQGGGSNARNVYSLAGVPAGTWHLRAMLPNASFSPVNFSSPLTVTGNASSRNFALDSTVTFAISGGITSSDGNTSGIRVTAGTASSTTDSRGGYYLDRLPNGTHTVAPAKDGYAFTPASRSVTLSGASVQNQNFSASPGATLPTVTIVATDDAAGEEGGNTGTFTISRTGSTGSALTVLYSVAGTATPGSDYGALPGSLTIPAGSASATIVITPVDDALAECLETVVLNLSSSSSYLIGSMASATVSISDNDLATINLSVSPASIPESGATPATVVLARDGCLALPLTVQFGIGGTATAGVDYHAISGSVTIPSGASSASVQIFALDDALPEPDETVVLTLIHSASYAPGNSASVTIVIVDDDSNQAPEVDAGPDQSINLLSFTYLQGWVADDGFPSGTLDLAWTMQSGPGNVLFGDPGDPQSLVSFSMAGDYSLTLAASDGELTASDSVAVTVAAAEPTRVVRAINAGGPVYTDNSGVSYAADDFFTDGTITTGAEILATSDPTVYRTARTGDFSYSIPVPNGEYVLVLKFAEIEDLPLDGRIFNLMVEGTVRVQDLDLSREVGVHSAFDVAIPVSVTDGSLDLSAEATVGDPVLNAILIVSNQSRPAAPTDLAATSAKKRVNLTWTQSTSSGVVQNRVYRAESASGPYTQVAALNATTSFFENRLNTGTTYYYVVTAVDGNGLESLPSGNVFETAK